MRFTRIIGAFVALFMVAMLPLVSTSSASAQVTAERALPKHEYTFSTKRINNQNYVLKGQVFTGPKVKIKVFRKTGPAGFKLHKKTKTKNNGKFSVRINGRLGNCFKFEIQKTGTNKKTKQSVGCIKRI